MANIHPKSKQTKHPEDALSTEINIPLPKEFAAALQFTYTERRVNLFPHIRQALGGLTKGEYLDITLWREDGANYPFVARVSADMRITVPPAIAQHFLYGGWGLLLFKKTDLPIAKVVAPLAATN